MQNFFFAAQLKSIFKVIVESIKEKKILILFQLEIEKKPRNFQLLKQWKEVFVANKFVLRLKHISGNKSPSQI